MAGEELVPVEQSVSFPAFRERFSAAPTLKEKIEAVVETLARNNRNRFPPILGPTYHVQLGQTRVELWVSPRRLPLWLRAHVMVVPVAPDLKMVFGVAKYAKDCGANLVQREAERVAPLSPGEAFVGTGGKYRFRYTGLAVIFDEYKRTSPQIIRQSVRRALELAFQKGARTAILPDFTENLLAQPNWITAEQKAREAEVVAAVMLDTVRACQGIMDKVKIWVWDKENAEFFRREMQRLEAKH